MEGPGMSMFQGDNLNVELNQLEEEEAAEDQKRRHEELGNELQNAFDDLIADDEYTVDSVDCNANAGPQHYSPKSVDARDNNFCRIEESGHCNPQNPVIAEETINDALVKIESLQNALESKTRECENVTKMVHDETKKVADLKKQLLLDEAEISRLNMTIKQMHELLVESKEKISELDVTVTTLKSKIKSLESINNQKTAELERVKTLLSDAQHKYMMVEKNLGKKSERHAEMVLKQANDRHAAQMDFMQQQLDSLRNKLEDKEVEMKTLDTRYIELQRSREALLIDKAETINQLSRSLEDAQRQCQELMCKQDYAQENIRLTRMLHVMENEADALRKTIDCLQERLTSTTQELEVMDSVLCANDDDPGSTRRSFSKGNVIGSTPVPVVDRLAKLKKELYRAIASQKEKREEIRKLTEELEIKNEDIKILKEEENTALVKAATYEEENVRLENKVRILQAELEEFQKNKTDSGIEKSTPGDLEQQTAKFHEENDLLKQQLENSRKELEMLKEKCKCLKSEEERERLKLPQDDELGPQKSESDIQHLNIDLEEMEQEHDLKENDEAPLSENEALERRKTKDSIQLELERKKILLKDAQNECDRLKNLYVEISNSKESLALELANLKASDLYKDLQSQKQKCINLERALQLMDLKAAEYEKLLKAEKESHDDEIRRLRERLEKANSEKIIDLKSCGGECVSLSCTKCIEYAANITKLEIQILQLENQNTVYSKEISDMSAKLDEAKVTIEELREKLILNDDQDKLINELKCKAQKFEKYIKCQGGSATSSGVSSPQQQVKSRDQSVGTSPELELKHVSLEVQMRIQDDMAKFFARELKEFEEKEKQRFQKLEEKNRNLKHNLKKISAELKNRTKEVEVLKQAMLCEREELSEIIKKRDLDAQESFKTQESLLNKCKNEIQSKTKKIDDLMKELSDRNTQIEAERQSMQAVMNQWEEQMKHNDVKQASWKKIVEDLKTENEKTIQQLVEKYNSAKRTAANYKRYAEDHEKHMTQESERMKAAYDASVKMMQNKIQEVIENQTKIMNARLIDMERYYENKLNKLRGDPHS